MIFYNFISFFFMACMARRDKNDFFCAEWGQILHSLESHARLCVPCLKPKESHHSGSTWLYNAAYWASGCPTQKSVSVCMNLKIRTSRRESTHADDYSWSTPSLVYSHGVTILLRMQRTICLFVFCLCMIRIGSWDRHPFVLPLCVILLLGCYKQTSACAITSVLLSFSGV